LKNNESNKSHAVLAVFAKRGQLGRVKTRMQPLLSAQEALSLHNALIAHVFSRLERAQLAPVELWLGGFDGPADNDYLLDEYPLSICNKKDIYFQEGVDLGARMAHAAKAVLTRAECVLLVGADCPSVDAAYIQAALEALDAGESIVIGPAEDGGYVLLGLRCVPACLFADMPWGSEQVMALTRKRLQAAGLRWLELPPRWDVDRPEDLLRLQALDPDFAQLTASWLKGEVN
jgi:rSAM/selenodomain-associated transferase 1